MKHIIKMDKDTQQLQDNLKQGLVKMIMNENTFIRSVDYGPASDTDTDEQKITIDLFIADEVVLTDD